MAVVLLDINMPNMNGLEVLDALEQKKILDQTPVIVITGGDRVLIRIADLLRKHFRSTDYIIRLGGDEFVVILNYFSDKDKSVEKIQKLNEELRLPDGDLPTVFRECWCCIFRCWLYTRTIYYQADKALYYTKENGRCGCTIYGEK